VKKPRKPPARYNSLEDATAVRAMAGQFHDAAMIKPMVERNLEKTGDTYSWRTDPRLRKPSALRMSEDQIDAFLQKITAPTLLIKAEKGLIVAAETSEKLKSLIPNLAMESLPGFHHLHLDTPEAVAKVILNWIDSKT
jgi:pimeloyl-ACP methyl ester carboxylesterase